MNLSIKIHRFSLIFSLFTVIYAFDLFRFHVEFS